MLTHIGSDVGIALGQPPDSFNYRLRFDFSDDGGVLCALKGREFSISPADVWFCADFGYTG